MDKIDDIVALTKALRDDAMMEHNRMVALETAQEEKLQELNDQVKSEIDRRAQTSSSVDVAVDAAWSAWVRRERAAILREIARIRALRLTTEDRAKQALAKYNASEDVNSHAVKFQKTAATKKADDVLSRLSILQAMNAQSGAT